MQARSFVQHCRHRARVAIVGIKPREHQSRHPHLGPTRIPPPPRLFWLLGALVTAPAAFLRRRGMLQPWENTSHLAPVPPALRSGSTRSLARSPPPRLFWLPGMLVVAPTSSCTAGGCCNRGKQLPVRFPSLPPLFCTLGGCRNRGKLLPIWFQSLPPSDHPPARSLPPSSATLAASRPLISLLLPSGPPGDAASVGNHFPFGLHPSCPPIGVHLLARFPPPSFPHRQPVVYAYTIDTDPSCSSGVDLPHTLGPFGASVFISQCV